MNCITLYSPEVRDHRVCFRWHVEPATALYRKCEFSLNFPENVPLAAVPEALWWRIALVCLHPHWYFLRPCVVRLPVTLASGECEFWARLLDCGVNTLDAYRGARALLGQIAFQEQGPSLPRAKPLKETGRCAAAFSGGKDSLLQAGLLREMGKHPPLLVTTTSPMPPLEDHLTARRRHVLKEIARRGFQVVEVESDYRANWDNDFARRLGYPVSLNEVSDTFLYSASLVASATALGATHLFLASENEVQQTAVIDGKVVQHPHFMYSTPTQRALDTLMRFMGIRYGSLTSPLHSYQVQQLLWRRYPDLRTLQYSCWRVKRGQSTCSQCSQCLRIALVALAGGHNPARMGIDLVSLFRHTSDWCPDLSAGPSGQALPRDIVRARLHAQTVRSLQATSLWRTARALFFSQPHRLLSRPGWVALNAYRRMQRRLQNVSVGEKPGYCALYLNQVDPLFRDRLAAIFAEHFRTAPEPEYADILSRGDALAAWITAPLGDALDLSAA